MRVKLAGVLAINRIAQTCALRGRLICHPSVAQRLPFTPHLFALRCLHRNVHWQCSVAARGSTPACKGRAAQRFKELARPPPPPPNLEPKSWAAGWGPQRSGVRRVAGSVTCGPQGCLPDDAGEGMPPSPDVLWASSTPMMVWRRAWCSGDAADGSAHSHVVDRIGGAAAVAPGHAAWRLCSWTLLDCAAYSITTRLFDPQIHLVSQSSLRFQDSCHRFLGAPAATLCRGREIRLRSVR